MMTKCKFLSELSLKLVKTEKMKVIIVCLKKLCIYMCQRVHNNIHYFTQWKNKSTKQTNIYNTNCQHRLPAIRISNLVPTHHATKSFITFPCNWFILTLLQMHGPWPSDQRERTREKLVRQKDYMARSPHYNPFVPAVIKNHTQRHSEQQ